MLNVYLSGEIHTDWRDEIISQCKQEGLDLILRHLLQIMNYQITVELRYLAKKIINSGKTIRELILIL